MYQSGNFSSPHCLYGKFINTSTPPSKSDIEKSLRKQCNISGHMDVSPASDIFVFLFSKKKDKKKVLLRSHIYINGVIIVFKDPNSLTEIDFNLTSFIVTVVGLPSDPNLRSRLGDKNNNTKICRKVKVDLRKPLKAGFYIGERFVEFKYRNLGDFCYNCGMIGHIDKTCPKFRFPKKPLRATSRTSTYGPWLRATFPIEKSYKFVLIKSSPEKHEFEKTLWYPQFFIEIEFNNVLVCNSQSMSETKATHRFRFPCSYLNEATDSTDFTVSKAYEVLEREIYENMPFCEDEFGEKSEDIKSLVDQIKNNDFCGEDMWLPLKLQINRESKLTPVDYQTMLETHQDMIYTQQIENKISNLIKTRVGNKEDLLSLSSWEHQIREVISEICGFSQYATSYDVSRRAIEAKKEAAAMEISSTRCPVPVDKSTFSCFKCFKVVGSDMDLLDPCVICGEEMFLGEEGTVLPCSHVFHRSCIEKWFHVGHKCPLCGFQLTKQS